MTNIPSARTTLENRGQWGHPAFRAAEGDPIRPLTRTEWKGGPAAARAAEVPEDVVALAKSMAFDADHEWATLARADGREWFVGRLHFDTALSSIEMGPVVSIEEVEAETPKAANAVAVALQEVRGQQPTEEWDTYWQATHGYLIVRLYGDAPGDVRVLAIRPAYRHYVEADG